MDLLKSQSFPCVSGLSIWADTTLQHFTIIFFKISTGNNGFGFHSYLLLHLVLIRAPYPWLFLTPPGPSLPLLITTGSTYHFYFLTEFVPPQSLFPMSLKIPFFSLVPLFLVPRHTFKSKLYI